jgi:glycosyltransferase involved in cell wall biosynthesis
MRIAPSAIADDPIREIVLIYFSFFPSEFAVGPTITVKRLAMHLSRYLPVRILTLNYDEASRRPLFPDPHHVVEEEGYVVEYLPYDLSRYRYLYRHLRKPNISIGLNCVFDYRLAIPALMLQSLVGRSKHVVHFPHGIFLDAVLSQKHLKKALFCRGFDTLRLGQHLLHVASSEQEAADIRQALKTPQHIVVLPHFGPMPPQGALERAVTKQPGELRICLIGRVAAQKNVIGALDVLARLKVPCQFDVIGAIEDEAYHRECMAKVEALPSGVVVRLLGAVPHAELMNKLGAYHALFSPTLGENFGHAILEALGCGLPALISDRTPWQDLEVHRGGWVVNLDSPERFVTVLEQIYQMGSELPRKEAIAYATNKANPPGLEQALLSAFGVMV